MRRKAQRRPGLPGQNKEEKMSKKEPRVGWGEYHYDHELRGYQATDCPRCDEENERMPARD